MSTSLENLCLEDDQPGSGWGSMNPISMEHTPLPPIDQVDTTENVPISDGETPSSKRRRSLMSHKEIIDEMSTMSSLTSIPFQTISNMFESSSCKSLSSKRIVKEDFSIFRRTVMQMHSLHKQNLAIQAIKSLPQMTSIINGMKSVLTNNTRVTESTVTRLESIIQSSSASIVSDKSDQTKVLVDRVLKKLALMAIGNGKDRKLTKTVGRSDLNKLVLDTILSLGSNSPKTIILALLGRSV